MKQKSILITGISRGIGKAISLEFKNDYNVYGISRTDIENCEINHIKLDLTNKENIEKIIKILEEKNIKLDSVIINAGLGHFGKFENGSNDKYEEIINLNLLSPIILINKLIPLLENKAKVIFIGSIIGKKFMKYSAVYQASKFGLRGFAGALKNELKGKKIYIINPRIVNTSFHDKSEIDIQIDNRETKMKDILQTVNNILQGIENRFEIDL